MTLLKKDKKEETMAEEEVDSAEASEAVLDTVEETNEVAVAEVDEQIDESETLRSVASEWLGSILQSTPKK